MLRLQAMAVPGFANRERILEQVAAQSDLCVHYDHTRRGPLPTLLDCLRCALEQERTVADGVPWVVVVQDDAQPFRNWEYHLLEALEHAPQPILGLSATGTVPGTQEAVTKGAPYVTARYATAGGAFALRWDILDDFVRWATPFWEKDRYIHDDSMMVAFSRYTGRLTARTTYALFDQRQRTTLKTSKTWHEPPVHTIESTTDIDYAAEPHYLSNSLSTTLKLLVKNSWRRQNEILPSTLERSEW